MPTRVEFSAHEKGRLDKVVADYLQKEGYSLTRSSLKSQNIPIVVNGKPQKLSYVVSPGECITVDIPDPEPSELIPEPVDFEILYQDEHIAVINKPAGIVVHPAKGHTTGTLVHGLLYALQGNLSSVGGEQRPGIVHRLDKDTAGLMIVALTDQAHHKLTEDFKNHRIQKIYHTIVKGHPAPQGVVDAPIGRGPHDRKKMSIVPNGKPARSAYRVLEYLQDHAYVEVEIFTGRTHQIRVHMTSLGHPIAGDPLYSRHSQRYPLKGIALCAKFLAFSHPATGKLMEFSVPLPKDMEDLLQKLKKTP
ncbi:RluA family pseudouridine synthase [Thermospira aquatica]|uniref:Pseudouridine synthase n=1 Tax=Thermospira aquatica TaxID=2828656 RepID=A0AAX3BAL7_9SPIR|nr:RluA family pseudouridine synthase [Thermospira aquatica]URA09267.1 RluA family pseudouridine synthase [Thermospira aquatica]